MLLNELQATLQTSYQDVQAQIEALQQIQKQILDKMQSVGSVESELEGALALLAKGLRHAKKVCPEQIDRIKQINLDLYDQEEPTLPEIEGAVEDESDDTDPVDPVDPSAGDDIPDDSTISPNAVTVTRAEIDEALNGDDEIRIIPVEPVEVIEPEVESEVEPTAKELEQALSFSQLRKLAKDKGINAGGKATAIAKRLQGSVSATELTRLQVA